ncbi:hypothetical protein [Candidatus Pelagibacter sp. Uisw_127]|uniref:hypothetical protein n=1 Tax=Candidatus Pelagibacter sp. Uisw_127 TaxID=3230988 RepID=UPI0039E8ADE8
MLQTFPYLVFKVSSLKSCNSLTFSQVLQYLLSFEAIDLAVLIILCLIVFVSSFLQASNKALLKKVTGSSRSFIKKKDKEYY